MRLHCGTDILVVGAVFHSILNAECALHRFQVANLQAARETLSTTGARRLSAFFASALVEIDAHLRGALKDVEELSKWQIEQGEDNGHGMQLREKTRNKVPA